MEKVFVRCLKVLWWRPGVRKVRRPGVKMQKWLTRWTHSWKTETAVKLGCLPWEMLPLILVNQTQRQGQSKGKGLGDAVSMYEAVSCLNRFWIECSVLKANVWLDGAQWARPTVSIIPYNRKSSGVVLDPDKEWLESLEPASLQELISFSVIPLTDSLTCLGGCWNLYKLHVASPSPERQKNRTSI